MTSWKYTQESNISAKLIFSESIQNCDFLKIYLRKWYFCKADQNHDLQSSKSWSEEDSLR